MTLGKERNKLGPCQDKREGTEVGIHRGVGGAVILGDDNSIGEPDGETGRDDGVRWMGQVICIYPYVLLTRGARCNREENTVPIRSGLSGVCGAEGFSPKLMTLFAILKD